MENDRVIKQTKIGEGKRALLISTAIVGGEYETLVLRDDLEGKGKTLGYRHDGRKAAFGCITR